jgi:hypothetical protein
MRIPLPSEGTGFAASNGSNCVAWPVLLILPCISSFGRYWQGASGNATVGDVVCSAGVCRLRDA